MSDYKTSIPAFGYSHKEPLPCPFCGWGTIVDGGFLNHRCTCNACGATTKGYATWELAVKAWNRRVGKQDDYEKKDIPLDTDDIFDAELAKRILNNK